MSGSTSKTFGWVMATAAGATLAIWASVGADDAAGKGNIVTAIEEVQFSPLQPIGTSTAGTGRLWRDEVSGNRSSLIKFTKGSTDRHLHTFDYQLVVIKGTVTHWTEGMPEAGAKKLNPGSYWFQPRNQVHQDTCLVDECIMFVNSFAKGETKREADIKK